MADLIDRQAAIYAILKATTFITVEGLRKYSDNHGDKWCEGIVEAMDAVEDTPSAEPEIIHCKECSHYIPHGKRCGFWNHGVNKEWYCSQGERREDETD